MNTAQIAKARVCKPRERKSYNDLNVLRCLLGLDAHQCKLVKDALCEHPSVHSVTQSGDDVVINFSRGCNPAVLRHIVRVLDRFGIDHEG